MKKIFLLLVLFSLLGCEKDDICDENTPTTPLVIIEFYNKAFPTQTKNVTSLLVNATGFENFKFTATNTIEVPLNVNDITTSLNFIQNGGDEDTTNDNTDVLQFNYTKQNIYVSRACGYKTIFKLTNTNTDLLTIDSANWIDRIEIIQLNIETENETHIKIYF